MSARHVIARTWLPFTVVALGLGTLLHRVVAQEARPDAGLDWSFPVEVARAADRPQLIAFDVDAASAARVAWVGVGSALDQPAIWLRSRPEGGSWGAPELIWQQNSGVITAVDMTTDARGLVHVVWAGSTGADADINHTVRFAGGGWSTPDRVNDDLSSAPQDAPSVASDLWGSIHIAWVDHREGSADIYAARVLPGAPAGANIRVHPRTSGDQAEVALRVSSGGDLHAAWTDTVNGLAEIRAAQIPHAGLGPDVTDDQLIWWPPGTLGSGGTRQKGPVLVAGTHQTMFAAWIGSDHEIRVARLTRASPYWEADRVVYRRSDVPLAALAGAADVAGRVYLTWAEDSTLGRALMAGTLTEAGIEAARADWSPITSGGREPNLAARGASMLELAWIALGNSGDEALYVREAPLDLPPLPTAVHEGFLVYIPGRMSCPGDGYLVQSCDGATGPFVTGAVDPRFIGRWVRAEGTLVEGVRCPRMLATRIVLATAPCPRGTGGVSGVVRAAGAPLAGAKVTVGDVTAFSGPSGRFFVSSVPGGAHAITATARCSLLATEVVRVQNEFTTVMQDAELVRADAQPDCTVDLMDLVRVSLAYHSRPPFHPECADLDGNALVDLADLAAVADAFDANCPRAWSLPAPPAARDVAPVLEWERFSKGAVDAGASDSAVGGDMNTAVTGGGATRIVYRGAGAIVAWEIRVKTASDAPAGQPFVVSPGVWVVRNELEHDEAVLVAAQPGATLNDGAELGALRPGFATSPDARVQLAGAGGRPQPGGVELVGCGAACSPVFLPAVGGPAIGSLR